MRAMVRSARWPALGTSRARIRVEPLVGEVGLLHEVVLEVAAGEQQAAAPAGAR